MDEMKKFFDGLAEQQTTRGIFQQMDEDIKDFFRSCDEFIQKMKAYEEK